MNVNVMFVTNDKACLPTPQSENSAGLDLVCSETTIIGPEETKLLRTGICLEIPVGFVGLICERSSLHKKGLMLANKVGVIDSDYRGEVLLAVTYTRQWAKGFEPIEVLAGDRLAQLIIMPAPLITFTVVKSLSNTKRGDGGFGSTG